VQYLFLQVCSHFILLPKALMAFSRAFFGFLVSLLYPAFAALSVKFIFLLFKFALIWDENYRWIIEYQILGGAFWPIALPVSVAVSLYA